MSIWSRVAARFSPSSDEMAARKFFVELQAKGRAEAEAIIQPISALALAIVSVSWECTEALIPQLRPNRQIFKFRDEQIMYVFCEFLYFFMHIMNRHARSRLSLQQVKILQEVIEPQVVRPAVVEAFIGHWPVELKNGVEKDVYNKLHETDAEYLSRTDELLARAGGYPVPAIYSNLRVELALSTLLARTVIGLAGYDIDTPSPSAAVSELGGVIGSRVMGASLRAFGELVDRASAAIESSPTLPQEFREINSAIYGASPSPPAAGVEPVLHHDEGACVRALVDTVSRVGEGGTVADGERAAEVVFRWPLREYRYTRRAASANYACEWCESEPVAFVWQEEEVGGPVYLCALCDAAGKDLSDDGEAEWWVRCRMSS